MLNPSIVLLVAWLVITPPVQAATLAQKLSGRILLDVEQHGEAWYVDPVSSTRTYLGRPDDAFRIMQSFGLGITNADLVRIPEAGQNAPADPALQRRLAGRILLQVQEHGEAWYVDPVTLARSYLGRPTDAFRIMQSFGLGITSANLATIPMAQSDLEPSSPSEGGQEGAVQNAVPFVAQAPLGEWSDPRQQDGCEEAAVLMAVAWARNTTLSPTQAKNDIIAMSNWEQTRYGYYRDTSIADTAQRLVDEYVGYKNYEVVSGTTIHQVVEALQTGSVVIIPINGRVFEPFHYTPPGPERHVIVVHGYNPDTQTFTVHDPGTSKGANLRVRKDVLERSWRDYTSGDHEPIGNLPNSMIVIMR